MIKHSVDQLLEQLIVKTKVHLASGRSDNPVLIGIQTGGAWIAERINQALETPLPIGSLDISFYRDDFSSIGLHPHVKPSSVPCDIENRHILLVDDILQTGRTIRAALNEIFDYGRPLSVTLICLIELAGRELPIRPDIVGEHMILKPKQNIKLLGPEPLELVIKDESIHE